MKFDWIGRRVNDVKCKLEQRRANYKYENSQDRAARRTVIATCVIAAFTVVSALTGIKTYYAIDAQLDAMRGQLREMHDAGAQTDKLVDANVKLAGAAQKSADTADKNLIASQRAWVGTVDATIIKSEIGTPIRGTAAYINSGREPAKISPSVAEYLYSRDEFSNGKATEGILRRQQECLDIKSIAGFRFAWPTTGFQTYLIHFPEGQIPQVTVIPWSDRINQGQDIVAVQGCIVYEAFGDIHHTAFCYYYDSRTADMAHLNICMVGNYVD